MDVISLINMITTIFIALVVLFFTAKTYLFKKGQAIKGSFGTVSSIDCDHIYVSTVALENCKDKAISIYGIYLRFGLDIYIELEKFEDKPLILNPFEVYKAKYDQISFYSINCDIADLDNLLESKKKTRLVLATSNGKYVVRKSINRWDPITLCFKNHATALVHTNRNMYAGVCYGNAKFLLLITLMTDEIFKCPIGEKYYDKFQNFKITKKDIESKANLEALLQKQIDNNVVKWKKVEIIDLEKDFNNYKEKNYKNKINIESENNIKHLILGRLYTIWSNYKLKISNRKLQRENKKVQLKETQTTSKSFTYDVVESGDIIFEPDSAGSAGLYLGHTSVVAYDTRYCYEALSGKLSSLNSATDKWNDTSSRQSWCFVPSLSASTRQTAALSGVDYLSKPYSIFTGKDDLTSFYC